MTRSAHITRREAEFLHYAAPDGAVKVRVLFKDETAWLMQKALAELFGVGVPALNKHLKSIFESGELAEDSVVSVLETTAADGKTYKTRFYNLDAIIAVGYRVSGMPRTPCTRSRSSTLPLMRMNLGEGVRVTAAELPSTRIPPPIPLLAELPEMVDWRFSITAPLTATLPPSAAALSATVDSSNCSSPEA